MTFRVCKVDANLVLFTIHVKRAQKCYFTALDCFLKLCKKNHVLHGRHVIYFTFDSNERHSSRRKRKYSGSKQRSKYFVRTNGDGVAIKAIVIVRTELQLQLCPLCLDTTDLEVYQVELTQR